MQRSSATTSNLRRWGVLPTQRPLAPLYWEEGARLWICTGYTVAEALLCDTQERFGARRLLSNEQLRARGLEKWIPVYTLVKAQMLFQDEEAHRRLRMAIQKRFTATAADALHARVQVLVNEQLAALRHRSSAAMDLLADFASPLATKLSAQLLGLPLADLARFMRWNEAYEYLLASFSGPSVLRDERLLESLEEEVAYFVELIGRRRTAPRNDLLGDLMQAFLDEEAPAAADETSVRSVVANAMLLLAGGYKTTTNLIAQALLWLWRQPDQRRLLEANPALIKSVISETMRLAGSNQYVLRQALQDVVIGVKRIRRGQQVLISLEAANRDERVFPHPHEFMLGRSGQPKHLGFSRGQHNCVGAPYAELLARIAIPTFLHSFPAFGVIEGALAWEGHPHLSCLHRAPLLLGPEKREEGTTGMPVRAALPPTISIQRPRPLAHPRLRLFCLPHAGGDASLFCAWPQALPASLQAAVEICSIQLPGHTQHMQEPPFTSIAELVDVLVPASLQESPLFPFLDRPFAFFGVCLGALVGFELARALASRHGLLAQALFSAACRAPHLKSPCGAADTTRWSATDLVKRRPLSDSTPERLQVSERLMVATYACPPDVVLDCPIVACGATEDGLVSLDDLAAWQKHTRKSFSLYIFPGDHFFLLDAPLQLRERFLECLARTLRSALDSPESAPLPRIQPNLQSAGPIALVRSDNAKGRLFPEKERSVCD